MTKENLKDALNTEIKIYEKILQEKEQELNGIEERITNGEAILLIYQHMENQGKEFFIRTFNIEEQNNAMNNLKMEKQKLESNIKQLKTYLQDLTEVDIDEIKI